MLDRNKPFSLPEVEEKVLGFWKRNGVFEKSVNERQATRDKRQEIKRKQFTFYEGPPTANGRPGIHHVLARSFKDIILRYKTMRRFFVPRRGGWDTHGLPVELGVEKALGLTSKKEIEKYGVAAFNKKCKESVWQFKEEWEKLTERIGFWLDLKNPYITYENSYIEAVWGILKKIWDKKLMYKGHKVVPWCTRCGTALSSHELALGYKEVEDTSVFVKFKLTKQSAKRLGFNGEVFVLSWTTTPWTLPGNVALAVGRNIDYVIVSDRRQATSNKELFIVAKNRLAAIGGEYEVIGELKGKDLIGLGYEPLFKIPQLKSKNSYKIYPADFVTTTDGTGVVHTAVMYGDDDYNLGKEVGLPQFHTVGEDGRFIKEIPEVGGLYVKDKKTEEKIIKYLQTTNYLLQTQLYKHDYPFCWRCGTPLLYYARDSWFIVMSKLRKELLAENEKINWTPENIKHGRFGEWLKEIKDWAISRERYWGTPLPIWRHQIGKSEILNPKFKTNAKFKIQNSCEEQVVIGSVKELGKLMGGARNTYILMRHGESENNVKDTVNSDPKKKNVYHLTAKGKIAAEKAGQELKKQKIDFIFTSDFKRTAETASIVGNIVGVKPIFDARLREINTGFDGKNPKEYHDYFANYAEKFTKQPPNGETLRDVAQRFFDFLQDVEKKYRGKNILIVSHEYPLWMCETVMRGWSEEETIRAKENDGGDFIRTAEFHAVDFINIPRNEYGFGDLHKPYVDAITFPCEKCGKKMKRISEVLDVWFDSGAMPFASQATSDKRQATRISYPADYIAEGIDQTRGWFYTLLAIGVLMGKGTPYKNVISLGLTLDKNGQKMSKSKGNVVDPWTMIQKYGADTVRWYFYTVNPPGEPKKFDEADLEKVLRQFVMMIYNCFVFYDTYAHQGTGYRVQGTALNVLDKWILARLHETIDYATKKLDGYEIGEAARKIEEFVGDLSRWYIRRSRRRFQKPENKNDYEVASQTLGYVLLTLSKLLAPFVPFFAESLYQSLEIRSPKVKKSNLLISQSVHLIDWPEINSKFHAYRQAGKIQNSKLLEEMEEIRRIAALALAKRAETKVKVRQPLASLKIKNQSASRRTKIKMNEELLTILKEEVNVKEIVFDKKLKEEIVLDTNITHELREEGWLREFVRMAQDLRQDAGLEPKDKIVLVVESPAELNHVLNKFESTLKKEIGAKSVEYKRSEKFTAEIQTKLDEWDIWVGLRKL